MGDNYKGDEPKYVAKELAELTYQNFKLQQRIKELERQKRIAEDLRKRDRERIKELEAEKKERDFIENHILEKVKQERDRLREAIDKAINEFKKRQQLKAYRILQKAIQEG